MADELGPPIEIAQASLPLTSLQYARSGDGPPLIMVPATISEIVDWQELVRFVGQRYSAHFFELPGYGGSTPFEEPFSSGQVARTVIDLADHLGFDKFTLMGFSFGGVFAFKTLRDFGDRVDNVVLLSPCVSQRALQHSKAGRLAIRVLTEALRSDRAREGMLKLMHDPRLVDALVWFMTSVGGYETNADLRARLLGFSKETLDVLVGQVREIISVEVEDLGGPYPHPCFFAMSRNDPLLDYDFTEMFVKSRFSDLIVEAFDFDYHCPPEPFTFAQLDADYRALLSAFDDRE